MPGLLTSCGNLSKRPDWERFCMYKYQGVWVGVIKCKRGKMDEDEIQNSTRSIGADRDHRLMDLF